MPLETQGLRALDQNGVPLRIPKLTYRNRVPDSELEAHHGSKYPASQGGQPVTSSLQDFSSPVDARNPTPPHSPRATDTPTMYNGPRRSSASAAVSRGEALIHDSDVKRKKHSSLFGFLSLKEPSTSALEDFARQQKQATARGGRASAVGMPGTSTQKLPPSIPKVNSKWDGLPSPIKERTKQSGNDKRNSTVTVASRTSIFSSSPSSESSSQASLSSGSSIRLTSPTVGTISEIPELSDGSSNRTGDWARRAKEHCASGSTLSGNLASPSADEEPPDRRSKPRCRGSFSHPAEQPSSGPGVGVGHLSGQWLQTDDGLQSEAIATEGGEKNATAPLDGRNRHHEVEDLQGHAGVDTGQDHAATYSECSQPEGRRPGSSPSSQGAPTIAEEKCSPLRHQGETKAFNKPLTRAQAPVDGTRAGIIPWDIESSPPTQPSTISRSEDKEKRRLGFLSRRFK